MKKGLILALLLLALFVIFVGCEKEEPVTPEKMDITGLYEGTSTVAAAKNDSMGTVMDMTFRFVQNDNGTATLITDETSVDGSYNPKTGEFLLEHGFTWRLTFSREGDTIAAKGTMTSGETGEGFTQEITLDLKRMGD